eukprot:gene13269-16185_t
MTYKYNPFWQQRIRETVRHALNVHPRLTALRVDLRFPDVPAATDAAVISRFINALKARIDAYQKRKHREGKRVHPTTLHYVWAREFGECKGKKHYHLMLLVNRDTWCRAGDYRAPGSLAGMIKQAWCSALGVDVGCHATLVHFPAWPAVWLERDDDTGFQQVLERADYLAKEHTKAHCTARLARQYPANQKYGLLSGGNDVSTRPLTVFYVSVPLCDNHSAVTATSLLYPNSSPDFN